MCGVILVQVKSFAAAAVGAPVAGYPCPPYKLLILDEADSMTQVGWGHIGLLRSKLFPVVHGSESNVALV